MVSYLGHLLLLLAAVHTVHCQERIVGGSDVDIRSFPFLANVWYDGRASCGCSIVATQWVLSAAHCFPQDHDIKKYSIIAGTASLQPPGSNAQYANIDSVVINPGYNEDSYFSDIALIKLQNPLTLSDTVQIVTLPSSGSPLPAGLPCTIAGWGFIQQSVPLPSPLTLQAATVNVISAKTCNCLYNINPSGSSTTSIQGDMICAGYAQGGRDACQGDSGGPLTSSMNGVTFQVGLTNWGDSCGGKDRPGVYLKISAYTNWIQSIVPGCIVQDFNPDMPAVPDNNGGCVGSDGNTYPYPNSAPVVLVTFLSLMLYWLTAYLLTNL